MRARIPAGGEAEAIIRALIHVGMADRTTDERSFAVLRRIREQYGVKAMPLAQFKAMVRDQLFMLLLDQEAALAAIPAILSRQPGAAPRALELIKAVSRATGTPTAEAQRRLERVIGLFKGATALPAPKGKA